MINGNSIYNAVSKTLIIAGFSLIFLAGCVPNNQYTQVAKTNKVGIYNVSGWNGANCYFPSSALGSCTGIDIDAKVGYKLYVGGLRANCDPDNDWQTSTKIITSGSFPPGVNFTSTSIIKGIPEKRGHWIVKIKVNNLYCQDKSYFGLEQELRFHITGSGKVRY